MRIPEDLLKAVTDWHSGESMRVLQLGHSRDVRQQSVYECIFQVLRQSIANATKNVALPETIEEVNALVAEQAGALELSSEERGAAASFLFVSIRNGWQAALAGHAEHKYLKLTRESNAA